jgi:tryptophan-rich sensory protein
LEKSRECVIKMRMTTRSPSPTMTRTRSFVGLVGWFAVTFAAAAVGAAASIRAAEFYQTLVRPAWAPPAGVFGPVWSVLYTCMAVAVWLVWRERSARRSAALAAYVGQLGLNALWSWLFFGWHQGTWAAVEVIALAAAIVLTILRFRPISRGAALLLAPYLAWVLFASCLTIAVWRLNPAALP